MGPDTVMLVGAPFYYKGVYHMMWQSHTQYIHVPAWNKMPSGQFGDTGISFGHAVSTDLSVQATILQLLVICRSSLTDCLYYSAHWTQLENSLWPDEWCTFLTFRSHFLSQFSLIFSLISLSFRAFPCLISLRFTSVSVYDGSATVISDEVPHLQHLIAISR